MTIAPHRFNNDLRYRPGADEANRQLTPSYILEPVRTVLGGIGLDPCTEANNPTEADTFYTAEDDGLVQSWGAPSGWCPSVFVNPPYGRAREPWIERCIEAADRGQRVVALIPAHTDTDPFQHVLSHATAVLFVKGRVKFALVRENGRREAASHGSALIGWNVDLRSWPLAALGQVVQP